MASESTLQRLQAEFDNPPHFVQAVVALLEEGAHPDFVASFRRDESGDMREERISAIAERLHFLEDLAARKTAILEQAEQKGLADDELRQTLGRCHDQDLLDDIYQTFRPRRRTAGVQAREKGLGEIADMILAGDMGGKQLAELADARIDEAKDLPTREAALAGVLYCLTEHLAADPKLRSRFRHELHNGILKSKVKEGADKKRGAKRYQDFFDFSQPVRRIPPAQMLNLRHAERDGLVEVGLHVEVGKARAILAEAIPIDPGEDEILRGFLSLVFQHAYEDLIRPACESHVRHLIKARADRETVRALARNLRSQLLAPPLGAKKALGVRASRKTVWIALVKPDGSIAQHHALPVTEPPQREAAVEKLLEILREEKPDGVALPHGRHQEVTHEFLKEALGKLENPRGPLVVPIDEAASAIHATSSVSRKEMPSLDVGVRTAVSLARRMQDPMQELLGLDPKALGLGHTLDEVHQGILARHLDSAIASCVSIVGVDVNTASYGQLVRVPGMTRELAKKIVDHRKAKGSFANLATLKEDLSITLHEFCHVAGFLRIADGDEPLDATNVHPEDYPLAQMVADHLGVSRAEVRGHAKLRGLKSSDIRAAAGEAAAAIPELRLRDVLRALSNYGRDPRGVLRAVENTDVSSIQDLSPDRMLRGRITNLTEFGAFVDLGIGQDGLIHVSQIPPSRLRDPQRMLAVGEVVTVYVLKVDANGKRISLSMHKPRHLVEGRQPTIGERLAQGSGRGRGRRQPEPPQLQTRAARAPEKRRPGAMRRGPRPAPPPGGGDSQRRPAAAHRGGPRRDRSDRGDRGDRGRRSSEPKVVTVESERPMEESRGHKGELRSLSGLRNLLGAAGAENPKPPSAPAEQPQAAPPTSADHPATPEPTPPTDQDAKS